MALTAANIAGGTKTDGNREENDFYPTPPSATLALLERERFEGDIWEPACGDGAISKVLEEKGFKVYSSDLIDRGYGVYPRDFLKTEPKRKVDNIITNPPFKFGQDFCERSLDFTNKKVAMLLKLAFLESVSRHKMFENTPLKTVYVFSKRLEIYKNGIKTKNSGVIPFAWYVWEHGYEGKPQIEWIL